jgi:hypothetical protein
MGLSIPACLASLVALVALADGSGVPYQPMTPPAAKMSADAKPGAPAPAAPAAAAPAAAPAARPYLPPPASATKATAPAKATGKTATKAVPAPIPSTIVYVIRRTEDAWTVMDPAAIEKVAGGPIRRAYSVTVRRNLLNGGPPQPGYVRTLNEFDCDAMKFRWRTFTIFNRFGAVVVKQDNADLAYMALGRGSEEEDIFRTVCDGGGGGSVVAAPSLGLLVIGLMQGWDEAAMTSAMSELPPAPDPKPAAKTASKPRR